MRRRFAARLAAALALLPPACAVPGEEAALAAGEAEIWATSVEAELPADARVRLMGLVELRSLAGAFGGFSGLEVAADGSGIIAISDRSIWLEADLVREGERLVGVRNARLLPVTVDGGRPDFAKLDAEGLAMADPSLLGPRHVSFEQIWRVGQFDGAQSDETWVAADESWRDRPGNAGPEALAASPDGRLLAVREFSDSDGGPLSAWWIDPASGATSPVLLPSIDGLAATGADFGSDGSLYLLGRGLKLFEGFRFAIARLRREGDDFGPPEMLLRLAGEASENAEGIAAWSDVAGRTRLLVISDDNFNMVQRTLLYEFEVLGPG